MFCSKREVKHDGWHLKTLYNSCYSEKLEKENVYDWTENKLSLLFYQHFQD